MNDRKAWDINMGAPQKDLRYQKTEALIQKHFREMLAEMDFQQITIQELSTRAQINRKTFYLHYTSIDDLLHKIQADMLKRFLEPVKDIKFPSDLEKVVRNCYEFSESSDALDEKILNSKGHYPIAEPLIEPDHLPCFDEGYDKYPPDKQRYLFVYVNSCLTGIYRQWVEGGRKEPMEDMIQLTIRLISCGLS